MVGASRTIRILRRWERGPPLNLFRRSVHELQVHDKLDLELSYCVPESSISPILSPYYTMFTARFFRNNEISWQSSKSRRNDTLRIANNTRSSVPSQKWAYPDPPPWKDPQQVWQGTRRVFQAGYGKYWFLLFQFCSFSPYFDNQ